MQNPFESGHIKNYILFYVAIVVVMILFFIASTLLNDVASVDKKVFDAAVREVPHAKNSMKNSDENSSSRIKILESTYLLR